tara:strand:- start:61 stop:414 length:354 start_codon:yes stop_codon:yes gene_type:complete
MKDKLTAILLCVFLGGIGAHQFYLDNTVRGILYFLFSWTLIPSLICIIDIITISSMSEASFNANYNKGYKNNTSSNLSNKGAIQRDTADELEKLHELTKKGVLTEKEFQERKKKLLQ